MFREHPGAGAGRAEQKEKAMEMGATQTIDCKQEEVTGGSMCVKHRAIVCVGGGGCARAWG